MFARLTLKTATTATAFAAAAALLAPTSASAQSYNYQGPQNYGSGAYDRGYDYDQSRYGYQDQTYRGGADYQCRSDRSTRQGTGVAVGATLGAVVGSQLAARGRRTEGSILGGVIGAAVGAGVGGSSARDCGDRYGRYDYRYDQSGYGDRSRYGEQSQYGYQSYDRGYDNYDRSYQSGYGQSGYGQSYDPYGYGRSDSRDGCRTVEVRRRDYNGRYVTRYEQSCPSRY